MSAKGSGPVKTVRLCVCGKQTDPDGNTQENPAAYTAVCTPSGDGWLFSYEEADGTPGRLFLSRRLAWTERLTRRASRTEPGTYHAGSDTSREKGGHLQEGPGPVREKEDNSRPVPAAVQEEPPGRRMVFDPSVRAARCLYETPFGTIPMEIRTQRITLLGGDTFDTGRHAGAGADPEKLRLQGKGEAGPGGKNGTGSEDRRERPFRLRARIFYTLQLDPGYALSCTVTIRADSI